MPGIYHHFIDSTLAQRQLLFVKHGKTTIARTHCALWWTCLLRCCSCGSVVERSSSLLFMCFTKLRIHICMDAEKNRYAKNRSLFLWLRLLLLCTKQKLYLNTEIDEMNTSEREKRRKRKSEKGRRLLVFKLV